MQLFKLILFMFVDARPASDMGYKPSFEFQKNAKDPLVELKLTDSSELCLIHWPLNQVW